MKHSELTIVAVYGHNNGSTAIPALLQSLEELPGSRGLLISIEKPNNLPNSIEWKHIYPINYKRYSVFIMHSLYAFIETEFCLIVQDDGWVLNGKNFKPEFYDYDYIGSPSHCGVSFNEKSEIIDVYLQFEWTLHDLKNIHVVQNGGFSLRSKRFLEACNLQGLTHCGIESIAVKRPDGKETTWTGIWNEDVHLSALFKTKLEAEGYKFAPIEVAKFFSVEYLHPGVHSDNPIVTLDGLLGIHGSTRKLRENKSVDISKSSINVGGEYYVVNWLINKGYTLQLR